MRMDQMFCLKHKNRDVAIISIDEAGNIGKVAEKAERELLPFGTGGDRNRLRKWWKNRAVPISQGNIRNFLHREGIPSSQIYLTRNLGLSMTDCYWIKPLESDLIWEKVNLFTNDFGSETTYPGSVLQTGWPGGCETGVYGFTPASSVQGELKKKWVIEEGERYLVKGNYGSSYQQSLNEIMASRMHKALHFQHYTEYSLCNLRVKLDQYESSHAMGCYSRAFTDENLEFISGYEICESRKKDNELSEYENFIQICIENGLDKNEVRAFMEHQILTDFVITNTDRHFNNFGILRDSNTLQFVCMAPIFDSGNSMFWKSNGQAIPCEKKDFRRIEVSSFRRWESDLLNYLTGRTLLDLNLLPKRRELEKIYAMDVPGTEERYERILTAYERKIDLLDEFQRTGTIVFERRIVGKGGVTGKRMEQGRIPDPSRQPSGKHTSQEEHGR